LDEPAHEIDEEVSYGTVRRDKGNEGKLLADFKAHRHAKRARLRDEHIAGLRLYSSQAYDCINLPLRKHFRPHPFAATALFISDALKKLRVVRAKTRGKQILWRGLKDVCLSDEFKDSGGTEMACMSTTGSTSIAAGYALKTINQEPMIFRIVSDNFMSCGADISWLSVYPNEAEVLFPPLTYLQVTKVRQMTAMKGLIVDVKPSFSS